MKVALVCYKSSALRKCIESNGHEVVSIDILPAESEGTHWQTDALKVDYSQFDFVFAFPPCTYLAIAQVGQLIKSHERQRLHVSAGNFVIDLLNIINCPLAIENPVGLLNRFIGRPQQIVYPWQFGDPYRKQICLWLHECPPLISTCFNPIRKPIANHVNSRMSQALKSQVKSSWDRYPMMCQAIADQWFRIDK